MINVKTPIFCGEHFAAQKLACIRLNFVDLLASKKMQGMLFCYDLEVYCGDLVLPQKISLLEAFENDRYKMYR